jgi:hypothetical protein
MSSSTPSNSNPNTTHPPALLAAYLKAINRVRIAAAVAMAVCGFGFVVCVNNDDYLRLTLRRDSGIWEWGVPVFGTGVYACVIATLLLIVEYFARPTEPARFTLRSVLLRTFSVAAICLWMVTAYGPGQGIGALVGSLLLLAALRQRRVARAILATMAVIVLSPTLLSTQSAYQYARRHADAIVAAGRQLADQFQERDIAKDIPVDDPRVPSVLRSLGARRIHVDEGHVHVYVPGLIGFTDREFMIDTTPDGTAKGGFIWIERRGKGVYPCDINDRLVMNCLRL